MFKHNSFQASLIPQFPVRKESIFVYKVCRKEKKKCTKVLREKVHKNKILKS